MTLQLVATGIGFVGGRHAQSVVADHVGAATGARRRSKASRTASSMVAVAMAQNAAESSVGPLSQITIMLRVPPRWSHKSCGY
jgi:hypothetical protein